MCRPYNITALECGPMPNVMAAMLNLGHAFCESSIIPFLVLCQKLWLTPTTRVPCSNPLKFAGCPKLLNRAQPLVGWSSPYCEDTRRYCCTTRFFPIVDTCLSCEDIARQSFAMVPRPQIFGDFFMSCIFSEPRGAHFRPAFQIRTKATSCVEVW